MAVLTPSCLWGLDASACSAGGTNGTELDKQTCHTYWDSHVVPEVLRVLAVLEADKTIWEHNISCFVSEQCGGIEPFMPMVV